MDEATPNGRVQNPACQTKHIPKDMQHGWCCRGDLSQAEVKRDVEAAMKPV